MCVGKECQTRVSFTDASLYPVNLFMQTAYKTYSDLLTVKIDGYSVPALISQELFCFQTVIYLACDSHKAQIWHHSGQKCQC